MNPRTIPAAATHSEGTLPSLQTVMTQLVDQSGTSLSQLSQTQPTLVVFLRHSGCTFCKETLADLSREQVQLKQSGCNLAIVTMSSAEQMVKLARRYDLETASWFSDPERVAYRAFELRRGSLAQLFGLRIWIRGIAATFRGHLVGKLVGDGFQMPGAFVVHQDAIIKAFRHQHASDRLNYAQWTCANP